MCEVTPGNYYYIVNTANSLYTGSKLAISFNGENASLTADPLDTSQSSQVWNVIKANNGQIAFSPLANQSLQIAYGSGPGFLTTLSDQQYWYTWVVNGDLSTSSYTIEDGTRSVFWYLQQPQPDEAVTYGPYSGVQTQFWWLYNA